MIKLNYEENKVVLSVHDNKSNYHFCRELDNFELDLLKLHGEEKYKKYLRTHNRNWRKYWNWKGKK